MNQNIVIRIRWLNNDFRNADDDEYKTKTKDDVERMILKNQVSRLRFKIIFSHPPRFC